jgi:predicted signal transduction protein with EAL and GGDEF domain
VNPRSTPPLDHLGTDDPGLSLVRLTAELQSIREELDATIRLASHDALTGLPNRRTITERLPTRSTSRAARAAWLRCSSTSTASR